LHIELCHLKIGRHRSAGLKLKSETENTLSLPAVLPHIETGVLAMRNSSFKNKFPLRLASVLILFSFVFSFLPPSAQGQTVPEKTRELITDEKPEKEQKRLALVIGNGTYQHVASLKNPANDAMDITKALDELGFEVISGVNQNKAQMKKLIREFGDKLMIQKGVGLFFFAGHGVRSGNKNYLVPVDAEILREDEIEDQAVDINLVMGKMDSAQTNLNIIMLDACRNNPFAKEWSKYRAVNEQDGLAKIDAPRGTVMFYAAEPGKVALDGAGRNGTFTEALLEQIKKPDVELDAMIKLVKRAVLEKSKNKQAAYVEATNFNDFYFAKTADKTKPTAPEKVAKSVAANDSNIKEKDAAAREQEAWELTKNSTDEDIFRLFLKEFPNGANASNAKIKLEQMVWDSIKTTNDSDAVERFLQEFPDGANKGAARIKLQRLKTREKTTADEKTPGEPKTPTDSKRSNESKTPSETETLSEPKTAGESKTSSEPETSNETTKTSSEPKKLTEPAVKPIETAPNVEGKTRFQREAQAWDAVRSSADGQELRAFLENFPVGANAEKAKIRLEQVLWDARRATKDKALIEEQLKEFPNGANAPLARIMLRQLEKPATDKPGALDPKAWSNAVGMELVFIPAGSFMMGASAANISESLRVARQDYADFDQTQLNNEKPIRRVTFARGFWMGKFEVTQAQWAAVMGDNPSNFKGCDNCPIERVSWEMAKIFVQRLNELDDGLVYRLPSEAEWEYAARAGTAGVFSGRIEAMSWHSGNSEDKTHPVGEKLPNPFGLYDIYGNVSEWCEDIYSPTYEGLPIDGTPNTSVGNNKMRVIRGGSWNNFPTKSRSTFREQYPANAFGLSIGFRVAAVQK
jgi:formylglycine-generating enzyme required for sulfatase activity